MLGLLDRGGVSRSLTLTLTLTHTQRRLVLLRHAEAEPRTESDESNDRSRSLTDRGRAHAVSWAKVRPPSALPPAVLSGGTASPALSPRH
jgi:broad specificity phosphatase PhoE